MRNIYTWYGVKVHIVRTKLSSQSSLVLAQIEAIEQWPDNLAYLAKEWVPLSLLKSKTLNK